MGIFISEPCFIDGYQAYHAGLPVEANPFLFQANPLRLWCHGWNVAMLVDLANQGIFELPGDFGTVDDNAPGYKRIDKEPFDQGRVAYAKGLSQADCPYGPETTNAFEWRMGWSAAKVEADKRQPQLPIEPQPQLERLGWFAWLARVWRRVRP
jgi:ribosome modulation factor